MKNWQKWLLIFRDIFYGLFVAKLARKWHRVCKIKSWKSKSDLSFSIWLKVGSLEVSNAKSVHANNRWLHCALLCYKRIRQNALTLSLKLSEFARLSQILYLYLCSLAALEALKAFLNLEVWGCIVYLALSSCLKGAKIWIFAIFVKQSDWWIARILSE